MRAFLLSIIVLVSALSISPVFAGGIEAVQLDNVPVHVSLKCDRIFFQATQQMEGVIYALPRVIPEVDEHLEDQIRMVPNPRKTEGKPYALNFRIYFPRDDEEIKQKMSHNEAGKFKACNFEQVRKYINDTYSDMKIHTVASMPITSFEVSIPELAVLKVVGRNASDSVDPDILDYQGRSYELTYELTEKEMAFVREMGDKLQAHVRFKFQARRRDGSLSVKVDMSKLATNFEAAVKGKYKILKGDLEATLRIAMDSTKVEINQQAGSENFNMIATKIIDKVLSELDLQVKDVVKGDKPQTEAPNEEIDVKIVADIIRNSVSNEINYNNFKAVEEASASSVVDLNPGSMDPNMMQVRVVSGEGDVSLNQPINAGDTVSIIPAFETLLDYQSIDKVSYLSLEQMKTDEYSSTFRKLMTSGRYTFVNQERNGFMVGVMTPNYVTAYGMGEKWYSIGLDYWQTEWVWRRIERIPEIIKSPRTPIEALTAEEIAAIDTSKIKDIRLAHFDRFPVGVGFTNVGNQRRRFKFQELVDDNEFWTATFNEKTGAIDLKAKQDLGLLVFKERFKLNGANNDLYPEDGEDAVKSDFERTTVIVEKIIQEQRTTLADIKDGADIVIRTNGKAPVKKRIVTFNVTRKDAKPGAANGN